MSEILDSRVLRFALVGVGAAVVDIGVFEIFHRGFGMGYYAPRVISFLAAVTVAWLLNRRFTFDDARKSPMHLQWFGYLSANALGGIVNFGVYSALVSLVGLFAALPALAIVLGALAGMILNYTLSRKAVFRP